MAIPIANFDDFQEKFEELKDLRDLFAFFLFDEGPGQGAIEAFADSNFPWLDKLAAASRIFFFVFIRRAAGGIVSNPSIRVAGEFGINANQLPGILLFTLDERKEEVEKTSYLRLKKKLFDEDPEHVANVIRDLFSVIQRCRRESASPAGLLACVQNGVNKIRASERARPLAQYAREMGKALAEVPRGLILAIPEILKNPETWKFAGM